MNRLRQLRTERRLTIRQLGDKAGISYATISRLETEKRPFTLDHLTRLSQFFDCSFDYILGKSDERKPQPKVQFPELDSVRKVLMPHEIIELLVEYTKEDQPDDFIFGKKKAFSETSLIRYLNVHAKAAGLEPIVLYGFRHSHATNLIKAGVPIKIVSKRLGHKNASTTMNVYWHLFQDDEQQVLEALKNKK